MAEFFPPPSQQPPAPIIVEPSSTPHTASVLILHGYGDSGDGWEMLPSRTKAALPHAKWILPSAPMDDVVQMRSWFEISDEAISKWREHGQKDSTIVDPPAEPAAMLSNVTKGEDPLAPFIPAIRYVQSLIDAELASGIPSDRIVIVGFSQGGALALLASLLGEQRFDAEGNAIAPAAGGKYAAVFPIGTFLPAGDAWKQWKAGGSKWKPSEANATTLHCLMHGTSDMLVPHSASETTAAILKEIGFQGAFFLPYRGVQHWVSDKQIEDLGSFLARLLPQLEHTQ
ncbi:Alpha/Beta hydrolase protein [Hyaloraphidium curvatum]|nr:Alpha/Beta hydrolase protein [Hyaloraphidium curvatum]